MKRYLVVGLEQRRAVAPLEGTERQSMSVAFARQLYKAATGSEADTQTYIGFRDKLFKGPNRVFDFMDIRKEGRHVRDTDCTSLRTKAGESNRVILLGKTVAKRVSVVDVPRRRRVELGFPNRTKDREQQKTLAKSIMLDYSLWGMIVQLASDL